MSKTEELLKATIEGTDVSNFKCRTRKEHFLKKCACGEVCDDMTPRTREEELLVEVSKKIAEGGGEDGLQLYVDAMGCKELFKNYTGDNVDFIGRVDTSNITDMSYMFGYCSNLTSIPKLDTSNATDMTAMFSGCKKITSIPELDTGKVTDMTYTFNNCPALTSIPKLDTKNVTKMEHTFNSCTALTSIPELDTGKVTNMGNMFMKCNALTSIPKLDTKNVTNMSYMFQYCRDLTSVPELDMNKVTSNSYSSYMFDVCSNITNLNLYNIRVNLQVGSGTSYGQLLTVDSLIGLCKECINYNSSTTRKLTVGTANLEKLANVYVKFTDSTQTTIATGEKGDIEVCESTDEGAMLISNYMTLKYWQLA